MQLKCYKLILRDSTQTTSRNSKRLATKKIYYRLQQLQTPENYQFYFNTVLWASASFHSRKVTQKVQLKKLILPIHLECCTHSEHRWKKNQNVLFKLKSQTAHRHISYQMGFLSNNRTLGNRTSLFSLYSKHPENCDIQYPYHPSLQKKKVTQMGVS